MTIEISEVRRRLRSAVERARREAAERRERRAAASREYEQFLRDHAVPLFHALASALTGERRRFSVETPAGSVRLTSAGSRDEFFELSLDEERDPPVVVGRRSEARGRRQQTSERVLRPGAAIADITDDDVLDFALDELSPFLER